MDTSAIVSLATVALIVLTTWMSASPILVKTEGSVLMRWMVTAVTVAWGTREGIVKSTLICARSQICVWMPCPALTKAGELNVCVNLASLESTVQWILTNVPPDLASMVQPVWTLKTDLSVTVLRVSQETYVKVSATRVKSPNSPV